MRSAVCAPHRLVQLAHDLDAFADGGADLPERFETGFEVDQGNRMAAIGGKGVEWPDLHGAIAFAQKAFGERSGVAHEGDLIVIGAERGVVRTDLAAPGALCIVGVAGASVVGADFESARAAERLVHGNAVALALEVPQRDVDGAGGAHLGADTVEAEIRRQQLTRYGFDAAGILAEHQRCCELMDGSLNGLRPSKALAEAGEPFVRFDFDPDQVGPFLDADGAQGRDAGH
ncbi:hypothetical protein ACVWWR_000005 [Bradyrhizobium sp. LM3.2]